MIHLERTLNILKIFRKTLRTSTWMIPYGTLSYLYLLHMLYSSYEIFKIAYRSPTFIFCLFVFLLQRVLLLLLVLLVVSMMI